MAVRILDTNVLLDHWHRCRAGSRISDRSEADARQWARSLIRLTGSNAILTPILVEFLCGVSSSHELRLARTFLAEFRVLDGGRIPDGDWHDAIRIASRVPRDGVHRHLGDCLVRAIANRLRVEVHTFDRRFPR